MHTHIVRSARGKGRCKLGSIEQLPACALRERAQRPPYVIQTHEHACAMFNLRGRIDQPEGEGEDRICTTTAAPITAR